MTSAPEASQPGSIVVMKAHAVGYRLGSEGRLTPVGRISDEDLQRVRDATDLVSLISETVVMQKKGRLYWGRCPFHSEKTPSFKVDPTTQLWHCFGCGLGGDAIAFVMQSEHVEFPDAVRTLADRARIDIAETGESLPRGHRQRLYDVLEKAAQFYHQALVSSRDEGAVNAREYLASRGFGSDVAKRFQLGWAPGKGSLVGALGREGFSAEEIEDANLALRAGGADRSGGLRDRFYERVMFPIRDISGRVVGFGGRVIGSGEPKYLNTSDTPVFQKSKNMYAIDRAKNDMVIEKAAIVVEGYTDVIALHEAGIRNVVATLGTALTRSHVRLLARFANRIVYLFDADEAGLRAAERAAEFIDVAVAGEGGREPVELLVAVVPEGSDPADAVAKGGADAVRAVVAEAVPLLRFVLDRRMSAFDVDSPEGRSRALGAAASVLASVKGSLLAQDYANEVADRLLVEYAVVQQAIESARPAFSAGTDNEDEQRSVAPEHLEPYMRIEREFVGLVAGNPAIRGRARALLASDLLTDPAARKTLELVVDSQAMVGAELYERVSLADSRAGAVLSGLLIEPAGNQDVDAVAASLVNRLKELRLERQIMQARAAMKSIDPVKDSAAYDDAFREVSSLQVKLDKLRRGESDDMEAWG